MVNQQAFGRRIDHRHRTALAKEPAAAGSPEIKIERDHAPASLAFPTPPGETALSLDNELREWKQSRRKNYKLPWRQVSLMASLCFGIAAFVLPDTVNDTVAWLFYALGAASLFASFAARRRAKS